MRNGYLFLFGAFLVGCGGGGGGSDGRARDTDGDGVADAQDCAAANSTNWRLLGFQSVDVDGDSHRVNSSGELCVGSALPSTHFASAVAASEIDCDDSSASTWQMQSYVSRDADADGFSVAMSGEVCSGTTLPAGYGTTIPPAISADCDDTAASVWRFMTTYRDADGDGVGAGSGEPTCVGANASPNRSLLGYDPVDDPSDPTAATLSNLELSPWQFTVPQN